MSETLRIREDVDPIDWIESCVQLDYGYFKRQHHPLIVEPLRMAATERGVIVGLIGSVQHIKTLTAQLSGDVCSELNSFLHIFPVYALGRLWLNIAAGVSRVNVITPAHTPTW